MSRVDKGEIPGRRGLGMQDEVRKDCARVVWFGLAWLWVTTPQRHTDSLVWSGLVRPWDSAGLDDATQPARREEQREREERESPPGPTG